MGTTITLYATPGTHEHRWATHALQRTRHPYETIDPTTNRAALEHIKALGYDEPPVIEVGDRHWPGGDPAAIRELIDHLSEPPLA